MLHTNAQNTSLAVPLVQPRTCCAMLSATIPRVSPSVSHSRSCSARVVASIKPIRLIHHRAYGQPVPKCALGPMSTSATPSAAGPSSRSSVHVSASLRGATLPQSRKLQQLRRCRAVMPRRAARSGTAVAVSANLFSRVYRILTAFFNGLVGSFEDPEVRDNPSRRAPATS